MVLYIGLNSHSDSTHRGGVLSSGFSTNLPFCTKFVLLLKLLHFYVSFTDTFQFANMTLYIVPCNYFLSERIKDN